MSIALVLALAYVQNISFSMVSRARNRDNHWYHATMSVFSNGIWFLTMHQLVVADLSYWLLVPYVVGTVAGSLTGSAVSMRIERMIGAKT
jgi:hypothetical protein